VASRPDVSQRHRERRQDTRDRILHVARELVEERPWCDISIAMITQRAGLTRSAFYKHFPDQGTLLRALLEELSTRLEATPNRWQSTKGDPKELLRAAVRALVATFAEHGRLLHAIADEATQDAEIAGLYAELGAQLSAGVAARIAADVEAGRSTVSDPVEVATAMVWMNERYLTIRFGRRPLADPDRCSAALEEIWARTVYGPPSATD
jgi:TetR/AcrR family transcriptional regulator, ethionamide resistance regulator